MHPFRQFTHQVPLDVTNPSFFENIIASLQGRMDKPTLFGWFHLLCLAIMFAFCVWIVCRAKKMTEKKIDLIMAITASVMILFEIYKQLALSYNDGVWHYQWYIFPFQFCSTPMYVMLIGAIVKNKTVKDACRAFMATYGLFGGAIVMFYPEIVYGSMIGINIQTMLHHGIMFVIGVMLYVSGTVKSTPKSTLRAIPVFLILIVSALLLNLAIYPLIQDDPTQAFNMFYISPYYPCELPILVDIQNAAPYPVFLLIYILGFTIAAFLMPTIALGVTKLHAFFNRLLTAKKADKTAKATATDKEPTQSAQDENNGN